MAFLRRLGILVAFVATGMVSCLSPASAALLETIASPPASVVDPAIQKLLSENIQLSKDGTTIYWSLQSLSTLPKPVQPGEDQYSSGGNSAEFNLDFSSLDLESLVGVQVIKDINTVILTMKTDKKEDLLKVLDVIHTLDQPKKQVLIRVMVAEISTDKAKQVHNRIQMLNKGLGGNEELSSQVSIDQGVIPDSIEARNTPGFQLYAVKEQAVQSFLTMQKTDGQFEVLSNPQVVVKHGEKAKIMVGSKINMVSGETSVSGNVVQVAQYADQNIGLEFMVTPYIYGNGVVGLDISQSMTELTLAGTDLKNVETNRRQVQTFASTKSGTTVVLGGMLQTRESRNVAGVPVLSRIPLLGKLFVDHRRQVKDIDLMLFITPFILDHPERGRDPDLQTGAVNAKPSHQKGLAASSSPASGKKPVVSRRKDGR